MRNSSSRSSGRGAPPLLERAEEAANDRFLGKVVLGKVARQDHLGREKHLRMIFPNFNRESVPFQPVYQPNPTTPAHGFGRKPIDQVIQFAAHTFAIGHVDQY